jgi:hypothetical protein
MLQPTRAMSRLHVTRLPQPVHFGTAPRNQEPVACDLERVPRLTTDSLVALCSEKRCKTVSQLPIG